MENNIREYVDDIFAEATPTRKSVELKEEMKQNLQDKYRDLVSEGKTPEAAYNIVVAGIGDVNALLSELESENVLGSAISEEARRKSAMFTAVAVTIYILAVLPLLLLRDVIGVVILIAMAAIATGLLVYNGIVRPSPDDDDDDDDELVAAVSGGRHDWQPGARERRSAIKAISSAMWSIVVAIYIIVSFTTGAWHITWVIFLIACAVQSLIAAFLIKRR